MKLYYAYRKQFSLILLGILFTALLTFPIAFSYAQSAQDIQNKIEAKNQDIAKLELEIKAFQSELDNLGKQKDSLSVSIKELDLNKKKLVVDIAVTQKKIDKTNLTIQNLSSDISTKQDAITNANEAIAIEIRNKNEFELDNVFYTLLSKNDFTLVWNDIDNMASVREKIREKILELKQVKEELEGTRQKSLDAKNELTTLKGNLDDQKKIVEQNTKEKNKLLAQTKNSEVNYQKLIEDSKQRYQIITQELRDYESQLKFILDPSKLPGRGILSWPLDSIFVTQLFGRTVAAKRLYASGSHSGVDFKASVGTPVKSMADGIVRGTGNTDITCAGASFGKWIYIEYNNGLSSAYGHLSFIKVTEGQQVKRGEVVGYSGRTGHVTGPHLHVTVYASSSVKIKTLYSNSCSGKTLTQPMAAINGYLDPLYYLPPYKI